MKIGSLPISRSRCLASGVSSASRKPTDNASMIGLGVPRGTTVFDDGSYLVWRVPSVSWSVDGRAIFPDSVAKAEAGQQLRYGAVLSPPWQHGDIALLPARHASAAALDADSLWRSVPTDSVAGRARLRLWVRRAWLDRQSTVGSCASATAAVSLPVANE